MVGIYELYVVFHLVEHIRCVRKLLKPISGALSLNMKHPEEARFDVGDGATITNVLRAIAGGVAARLFLFYRRFWLDSFRGERMLVQICNQITFIFISKLICIGEGG